MTISILLVFFLGYLILWLNAYFYWVPPRIAIEMGRNKTSSLIDDIPYVDKYPSVDNLSGKYKDVVVLSTQPYSEYDYYIIEYSGLYRYDYYYLYSPLSLTSLDYEYNDKKNAAIIYLTSYGRWNETKQKYTPFPDYPDKRSKGIANCWTFCGDTKSGTIFSDLPPIPGCIVISDSIAPDNFKIYYPENILPTFETIYPKIVIPQEQIIKSISKDGINKLLNMM